MALGSTQRLPPDPVGTQDSTLYVKLLEYEANPSPCNAEAKNVLSRRLRGAALRYFPVAQST
jgi:hypothetical protein